MLTDHLIASGALGVLLLGACGDSGSSSAASASASTQELAEYQSLALEVRSAAATYAMAMNAATLASCQDIQSRYDAQVRPWVSRMAELSGPVDHAMDGHGANMFADNDCVATTMMGELNHHRAVACTSMSLSDDQAEATRHAETLTAYATHVDDRWAQMRHLLADGGTVSWSPMIASCQSWDGCCSATFGHCGDWDHCASGTAMMHHAGHTPLDGGGDGAMMMHHGF